MSATVVNTPNEFDDLLQWLKQNFISKGFGVAASKSYCKTYKANLSEFTKFVNECSIAVPKKWKTLSDEQKKVLSEFAYSFADPRQEISIFSLLYLPIKIQWLKYKGEFNAVLDFNDALNAFAESIANAIECESTYYQQTLDKVYAELAMGKTKNIGKEIKAEDTSVWLCNLSDRVAAKV